MSPQPEKSHAYSVSGWITVILQRGCVRVYQAGGCVQNKVIRRFLVFSLVRRFYMALKGVYSPHDFFRAGS